MRLGWLSNSPWTPYGYGVQTALFGKRLSASGHPVGVISTYGHAGEALSWNGITVFGSSFHPYALDIVYSHCKTFQADALVTLLDLQVFETMATGNLKWLPWFPIDHLTIPPAILETVKKADIPITLSKHGSQEMDRAGLEHEYIPCGVDTQAFKPYDMAEARTALQFPLDKFIIGMVAMNKGNPSRKAFHQTIAAFAALQKKHGDCLLYLHTQDGTRGFDVVDLVSYCRAIGLKFGYAFHESANGADVIFCDQYGMVSGYPPEMMAQMYSALDVHSLVTRGEGFGIPVIEAQACGCPVIVGDWTSTGELCFSGWKVEKAGGEMEFTNMQAFQIVPRAAAIAEKMEAAYQMRGNKDYRERARKGSLAYDADKVLEDYWLPVLTRAAARFEKPLDVNVSQNLELLRV